MIKVVFIRHSKTKGNLLHRYIGKTDESLCKEGYEILKSKTYPAADIIYCSPMLRCIESADFIYKNLEKVIINDFKECDFGTFENKNYMELNGNIDYQKWIDSNGQMPFPEGEDINSFKERCVKAFEKVIESSIKNEYKTIALVIHGGTIMSILDRYSSPHKNYYDWMIDNGEMIISYLNKEEWLNNNKRLNTFLSFS